LVRKILAKLFPPKTDPALDLLRDQMRLMEKMVEGVIAQSKTLNAYIDLFKIDPDKMQGSRTMRDQDEWKAELRRGGYPVDAPADEQAKWVLEQSRY
jgi:hypothetical protein